jgi:CTP synthase
MKNKPKFIFVTGGTISGIGKGTSVASIGALLAMRGLRVAPVKIDPYLNKDAGTMNPYQHGEVYVTDDGAETDLDLGHYERFMNLDLSRLSNFTTGAVYERVIHMERHGDFLGKTIQIIPHVTDEIKRRILQAARYYRAGIVIVEIGGTVGDIEAEPFLEAARQMLGEYGGENILFCHVVKIDYVFPSDEAKTKPIQQSVALLRQRGIQPDFLIVRCKRPLSFDNKEKIALFTNVRRSHIIEGLDVETIYEVPINFRKAGLDELIIKRLGLVARHNNFSEWKRLVSKIKRTKRRVQIALVGKYVEHSDAYLSVFEAVKHAAARVGVKAEVHYIDAENEKALTHLKGMRGIIVPGGFGKRGIEGKIKAIQYARENNTPYLGLCLGLQAAVIEFARNVCKLRGAHSTEFNLRAPHPVIDILPEQKKLADLGGTMRLGASKINLLEKTLAAKLYGKTKIAERHRHRYEINPKYHEILKKKGLVFSGIAAHDKRLIEFIELPKHKFFIATQAHPEFKSRLLEPHPLFVGLVKAAVK